MNMVSELVPIGGQIIPVVNYLTDGLYPIIWFVGNPYYRETTLVSDDIRADDGVA
jgi:hypothetical protein